MSEDLDSPRNDAAIRPKSRRKWLIALAAVAVILAFIGYYFRDRIYFGEDSRTLDHMYLHINGGFGSCEDFPTYRVDLETSLLWDGTCAERNTLNIDPAGKASAGEEGFIALKPLSTAQVENLQTVVKQAHVNTWKSHYGSNIGCSDAGGWFASFVYTNGDVEKTTVEICHGSKPPNADILLTTFKELI